MAGKQHTDIKQRAERHILHSAQITLYCATSWVASSAGKFFMMEEVLEV